MTFYSRGWVQLFLILILAACSSAAKKTAPKATGFMSGMPVIELPENELIIIGDKGAATPLEWQHHTEAGWNSSDRFTLQTWIQLPECYLLDEFESTDCEQIKTPIPNNVLKTIFEKNNSHQYLGLQLWGASCHFKASFSCKEIQDIKSSDFIFKTRIDRPTLEVHPSCQSIGIQLLPSPPEARTNINPFLAMHCSPSDGDGKIAITINYPIDAKLWIPSLSEWNKTPGVAQWKFDLSDLPAYKQNSLARFFIHQENNSTPFDIYWNPRATLR